MKNMNLLCIRLNLFDGGAGGDGVGVAAPAGTGASTQGETKASPVSTRRGKSGAFQNILYGKQEQPAEAGVKQPEGQSTPADAGQEKQPEVLTTSNTLEERRKAFRDLVSGEYRDIYAEETQRMIDRRFRETKGLQQQVDQSKPLLDMLMQRYNITDGDVGKLMQAVENDNAYWSEAAEKAGMNVEQYKRFQQLQRQNAELIREKQRSQSQQAAEQQLQRWYAEGEELKKVYPSFDLAVESKDPQFLSMLRAGVPVRHAYEIKHLDEIKEDVMAAQAKATEKQIVENVRARGTRPAENGTASQSAFVVKSDVSKLTRADRAEIARRAARGEKISF